MTRIVTPRTDLTQFSRQASGALMTQLQTTGRFPPVDIYVKPLDGSAPVALDRFLSYSFNSSILVPVDTFNFSFVAPDSSRPLYQLIKDGDIVVLAANNVLLSTGIVDQVDTEVDSDFGEKGSLNGRDLMSQLEDQDAISLDNKPIFANNFTVEGAVGKLIENTRINSIELRNAPSAKYLLATEPGESKLAALQRFLEPLNCVSWMGASGQIIVGKPNFSQEISGRLFISKSERRSNVLSMKVVRSATNIPNIIVPIWSGQELVQDRTSESQRLENAAPGPSRLLKLGHRVPKGCVVSAPNATDAQGLSGVNQLKAGGANLLQAYAKREIARANVREIQVQAVVPGHFNESGAPWQIDTTYKIEFEQGDVNENMYLYQVEYQLSADGGQKTNLYFCRLGSIVSDVKAP